MSFCGALENRSEETGRHLSCGFVIVADNAKQPGHFRGLPSEVPSQRSGEAKSEREVPCAACPSARDLPVATTSCSLVEPASCPLEGTQPPVYVHCQAGASRGS